jgi:Restriction endonuclease EcoRV
VVAAHVALTNWLREQCDEFVFLPAGVYVEQGVHEWPLVADDPEDLTEKLDESGHLVSLPKESAALANVIEVALVDFLLDRLSHVEGATGRRGEERSYPDLEIGGTAFGSGFHAVDVKMARLHKNGTQTQSRCTLYTGNTYFKWPTIRWPGMFRSFDEYESHLDIIGVYRLDVSYRGRVRDLELFVHEPWRIASKERSSTTREYLGAVTDVAALREGRGEFATETAFYRFWRAYPFRVPKAVERQLEKALRKQEPQTRRTD